MKYQDFHKQYGGAIDKLNAMIEAGESDSDAFAKFSARAMMAKYSKKNRAAIYLQNPDAT